MFLSYSCSLNVYIIHTYYIFFCSDAGVGQETRASLPEASKSKGLNNFYLCSYVPFVLST